MLKYCNKGWPNKDTLSGPVKPYFQFIGELNVQNGLLLKGSRMSFLLLYKLKCWIGCILLIRSIIQKCWQRAQQSIWWPGLSRQLANLVNNCSRCCKERHQPPEPLKPSKFPVITGIPASKNYLEDYRKTQSQDTVCSQLMEFCRSGWPSHRQLRGDINKYWQFCSNFSVCNDLLLFRSRIVVPHSKHVETLQKIHQGHQGFQKCWSRVSTS